MKRPRIVEQIKEALFTRFPDLQVILFGSEARGDASPDSDVDLLILVNEEKVTVEKERNIRGILFDIELKTNIIISSIIISRNSWENRPFKTPFYVNVVNEGVLIEK